MNFVLEIWYLIGLIKLLIIERLGWEIFVWMLFGYDIVNKCKINK